MYDVVKRSRSLSEMCGTRLSENTGRKNRHFGTITQLSRAELTHVSTIGKKLLNPAISSTFPHNMVIFGLLTAEICWRVWGTPANFKFVRWCRDGDFLRPVFTASRVQHVSDLHPKFALRPHHVWK